MLLFVSLLFSIVYPTGILIEAAEEDDAPASEAGAMRTFFAIEFSLALVSDKAKGAVAVPVRHVDARCS